MKPKLCVFDIDGVLMDTEPIYHEIVNKGLEGESKWDYFHDQCNREDIKVNDKIIDLIKKIHDYGMDVKFLTGRSEVVRNSTNNKLNDIFGTTDDNKWWDLIMRSEGDRRGSDIVKGEVFKDLLNKYDIKLFVDDDIRNVESAEKLGINSLHYENKNSIANEVF